MKKSKVVKLFPGRGQKIKLSDAMCEAIKNINTPNGVSPKQVIEYMARYYKHREWSENSMRNYFYYMSRQPRFVRLSRGKYVLTGSTKRKVA